MKNNLIIVFGAAGNLGGKIADALISAGAPVGVIGRSLDRLQKFESKAKILEGDFGDDAFLHAALSQATSLFLTVPDSHLIDPASTAARLATLLKDTPVKHIVNISNSIIKKDGAPTRLVALEQELNKLEGIHIKHLRSANFFENLNWGINTPYLPDLQLPYISAYEVAEVAANYLLKQNFTDKSHDVLLGPRDYSMAELAELVGEKYVQLPYTPENEHFFRPFNEGDFTVEERTDASTSHGKKEEYTLAYFLKHDYRKAPQIVL